MKIKKINSKNDILESVLKDNKSKKLKEAKEVKPSDTGVKLEPQVEEDDDKETKSVMDHNLFKAIRQSQRVKKIVADRMSKMTKLEPIKVSSDHKDEIKNLKKGLVESLNEVCDNLKKENNLFTLQVKNRKELSNILTSLREHNIKSNICRSVVENYRYTVTFKLNEDTITIPDTPIAPLPDVVAPTPEVVEPNSEVKDNAIVSLLNSAIIDEFEAIDKYNSFLATMELEPGLSNEDIKNIVKDIIAEENIHVGQLQKCLELVSNNKENIDKGEVEAEQTINKEEPKEISEPSEQM